MCGIIGYIGEDQAHPILLEGLKRLEYRGYDSAGIATITKNTILSCRAEGKLSNLQSKLEKMSLMGNIGIGHTRWATHGVPNEMNAHPHISGPVAVVHNGIIENYKEIKDELKNNGVTFQSDTDTEVISQLLAKHIKDGLSPQEAIFTTIDVLKGSYALAILFSNEPGKIYCAKQGSPMAVGIAKDAMMIGSDAMAFAGLAEEIIYLEEGDFAVISKTDYQLYDENHEKISRNVIRQTINESMIGKGNHRYYMQKEIFEQPTTLSQALQKYINFETKEIQFPDLKLDLKSIPKITISACGSAYLAGCIAKYWIELYARTPVEVDLASELRYREPPLPENGLALFISQSGETADTLAALRYAKEQKQKILSIVNVIESSIARESDEILPILAGPEIGVASTKAFTAQMLMMLCLAIHIAKAKGHIQKADEEKIVDQLIKLPGYIADILTKEKDVEAIAEYIMEKKNTLFIGRGYSYPIAMEGALKLKELSYIHAEAYAAGELKHGPIALVDKTMPVIAIIPHDRWAEKTISNVEEVLARHGDVIIIGHEKYIQHFRDSKIQYISMPEVDEIISPIIYTIPVQLLSFHTALMKGTDVDQPRNLAKSVTVE